VRLSAHFAAAGVAVATLAPGLWEAHGFMAAAIIVLAIAWMTNLYNFMDGADGLAGGMAVIGFGAYAIAAVAAGNSSIALGSMALASSALAFLSFNYPPARVFMGDAGSIPIGFLAGALGLRGVVDGAWPAWFPFAVFAPFVVDSTMTLARRLFRGDRFWIAHRSHCYQRLVLSGWTTRKLAMSAYAVMAAGGASALVALHEGATIQCAILGFWSLLYIVAMVAIEQRSPLDSAS
jgi:UDP-GlcNAc:undecaprenyl-phosphate GlcNAc-1-phosphate transferase